MTDQTVGALLTERAAARPDQRFLWNEGRWLTYAETAAAADGLAAALQRLGARKGDRVAVILPNVQEAVVLVFACARLGAVQVPLNTFLRGEFLRYQLSDCRPSLIVTDALGLDQVRGMVADLPDLRQVVLVGDDEVAPGLPVPLTRWDDLDTSLGGQALPAVASTDTFSILYTSGTTGMPKGCVMPHGYATHIPRALQETGRFVTGDVVLTAAPLFHISGEVFGMMSALHVGGSIALEREFHASTFIERAADVGATVIFGAGAVGLLLLAQPPRTGDREHGLQRGLLNGIPPEAQLAIEERFGFEVVSEVYGHSECLPVTASAVGGVRNRASAGPVLPHVEVQLVDEHDLPVPTGTVGEIVVRPKRPGVMFDGYWNKPEATLETWRGLWHHTGDFGRFDDEGYLYFVDRKKDAIRRRGEFVAARELELAIGQHPDVAAVAVHAVSSELTEDEIKCWVVPRPGATVSPEGLFAFFKEHLPYFAIPRFVEVTEELPTNQYSRVMKHELQARPSGEATWDLEALGLTVERHERRGLRPTPTR